MEPTSATNRRWNRQIGAGLTMLTAVLAFGIFEMTSPGVSAKAPMPQTSTVNLPSSPAAPVGGAGDSSATTTAGSVPSSALQSGGGVDLSKVPAFVSALGQDGQVVGYVPKSQLFPASPNQSVQASPLLPGESYSAPTAADMTASNAKLIYTVYGPDLTTVVGHMYPVVGFVPLSQTPQIRSTTVTTTTVAAP